jgi:hypothetical protein
MELLVPRYTGALCRNCKHGFESMESFEHLFGANAEKIMADLPNFTNVQPQVQISELL